jgi:hypothetical protein
MLVGGGSRLQAKQQAIHSGLCDALTPTAIFAVVTFLITGFACFGSLMIIPPFVDIGISTNIVEKYFVFVHGAEIVDISQMDDDVYMTIAPLRCRRRNCLLQTAKTRRGYR